MSLTIPIETSARHIHITQEDFETLFGPGTKPTFAKELSQPGQYACKERLTVVGPKGRFEKVVILGPCRKETQVEISVTDARRLGIKSVIRQSGDLEGTPGCTLIGPKGKIELSRGVIVAKRHIHMNPVNANVVKAPLNYNFSSLKEYETEKCRIIHPKAIELYQAKFTDFEDFLDFHDKSVKQIFTDVPEEMEIQFMQAARRLLEQEAHLRGFSESRELLEDIELRNLYKEKLPKKNNNSKESCNIVVKVGNKYYELEKYYGDYKLENQVSVTWEDEIYYELVDKLYDEINSYLKKLDRENNNE